MRRCLPITLAGLLLAVPGVGCSNAQTEAPTSQSNSTSPQVHEALDLVPADALGFLAIKNLDQLNGKVVDLAQKLKAKEHFSLLDQIKKAMGIDAGLNEKGSAVLIFTKSEKEKEPPRVAFALPVTDYSQVAQQLGVKDPGEKIADGTISGSSVGVLAGVSDNGKQQDGQQPPKQKCLVAKKGNFALLARPEDRSALEQILSAKETLRNSLTFAQSWLEEQDICGVCTHKGVQVGLGLFVGNPFLGAGSTTQEQYKEIKAAADDIEKNVKVIAFGGRIEKEDHSRLLTRVYFEPGGSYAKWMAKAKSLPADFLDRFPAGAYFVAATAQNSAQLNMAKVLPLATPALQMLLALWGFPLAGSEEAETIPAAEREKLAKELDQWIKQVTQVGLVVYKDKIEPQNPTLLEFPGKDGSGYSVKPVVLATVKNTSAFVNDTAQLLERLEKTVTKSGKLHIEFKLKKTQVDGKPALFISMPIGGEVSKTKKDSSDKEKGKTEKPLVFLLAATDDQTIVATELTAESQAEPTVKKMIEHKDKGFTTDMQLKKAVDLLPKKLQLVIFANATEIANALAASSSGKGKTPPKFPDSPPIAFTFGTFDAGIESQFLLPFETVQGFFEMARPEAEKEKPNKEK